MGSSNLTHDMREDQMNPSKTKPLEVAILGLGYVGLPLAVEFGKVAAGVEMLESLAERQAAGKGVLNEADLAALGVSLDEAKALTAALKASRAQKPDRDERPEVVKDSPFAALSALTAKPAPARAKRKRPHRTRTPG